MLDDFVPPNNTIINLNASSSILTSPPLLKKVVEKNKRYTAMVDSEIDTVAKLLQDTPKSKKARIISRIVANSNIGHIFRRLQTLLVIEMSMKSQMRILI